MRSIRWCARVCIALALTGQVACTQWRVDDVAPEELAAMDSLPHRITVVRHDRTRVLLLNPRIDGDSLRGSIEGSAPPGRPLKQTAVAVDDVAQLAVTKTSGRKTGAALVGPPLAFLLAGFLVGY